MLLLGIDFETTGLDPEVDSIIEIGLVFWDTVINSPVRLDNFLVRHPDLEIKPNITEITGITSQMCEDYGRDQKVALKYVTQWVLAADYIVAHNAPFDRAFLYKWFEKNDHLGQFPEETHWIDTKVDIDSQMSERFSRKLVYMAADHGFLNPFPHRAVFDVMAMFKVLSQYEIQEVINYGKLPSITVQAVVSYDDREKAKAAGFHWKGERKSWEKSIKTCYLETAQKAAEEAGFHIEVVSGS